MHHVTERTDGKRTFGTIKRNRLAQRRCSWMGQPSFLRLEKARSWIEAERKPFNRRNHPFIFEDVRGGCQREIFVNILPQGIDQLLSDRRSCRGEEPLKIRRSSWPACTQQAVVPWLHKLSLGAE